MGMNALTIDSARVRAGSWRGSDDLAYLVPLSGASTLTPSTLERIRAHLREDGFRSVVTAAVGPPSATCSLPMASPNTRPFISCATTCKVRSRTPARARGLRRGRRRDVDAILDVDRQTFEAFWQLDRDGLYEAINATPATRLRVVRDPDVVGYAVTGRAGTQGYLQRLAVHPDRQGLGLGIDLVVDALHWLRRRDVTTCWVNTQEANAAALSLYTRLGFIPARHQLTVLRRDL